MILQWTFLLSSKRQSRSCTTCGCVSISSIFFKKKLITPPYCFESVSYIAVFMLLFFTSSCRHTFCEHVWLPGLVLCGYKSWCRFWFGHALVSAVYPLFIHLLVQTAVRGIQVSRYIDNHTVFCSIKNAQTHLYGHLQYCEKVCVFFDIYVYI